MSAGFLRLRSARGRVSVIRNLTVFAMLELYRKGEVSWSQSKPFGPIEVRRTEAQAQTREAAAA